MGVMTAWRYVASIDLLTVESLRGAGVTCILFDRDNTVVPRDTKVPPAEVLAWFDEVRQAGISCCMVSNNFHTDQVQASARELGVLAIDHAMKPFPFAIRRALKKMGVSPHEAIMVGDQLYTDVVAANLSGVRPVLVRPQSRRDLWYTLIMRVFENMMLRGKTYEGE